MFLMGVRQIQDGAPLLSFEEKMTLFVFLAHKYHYLLIHAVEHVDSLFNLSKLWKYIDFFINFARFKKL